jgi:ribosomal protein S17E
MIEAKPVIPNRYWILKQDNRKVGQIEADDSGVTVKIQNRVAGYKTIKMASREANIEFTKLSSAKPVTNQVHGYEVTGRVYNPVWDVKHRLPLFTRDTKSKSWYAAGWYMVKQHRAWKAVQNPKLITLQRYQYQGPFHSKEEANASQSQIS